MSILLDGFRLFPRARCAGVVLAMTLAGAISVSRAQSPTAPTARVTPQGATSPAAAAAPELSAAESEGASRGERQAAQQFKWLDANGDGFLSREEVALFPRLRDAFDQADTNRDGRVSFEEIRILARQQRAEREARQQQAAPTTPAPRP